MSEKNSVGSNNAVTGVELLTILFVALKLTGYIHWSWWWVLSPLWIYVAFLAVIALVVWVVVAARG